MSARRPALALGLLLALARAAVVDGSPSEWGAAAVVPDPQGDAAPPLPGLDLRSFSLDDDGQAVYLMVRTWGQPPDPSLVLELTLGGLALNVDRSGVRLYANGTGRAPVLVEGARVSFGEALELSLPSALLPVRPLEVERLNLWLPRAAAAADLADACPVVVDPAVHRLIALGRHRLDGSLEDWGEPAALDGAGDAAEPEADMTAVYLDADERLIYLALATAGGSAPPLPLIELTVGDAIMNIDARGVRWFDRGVSRPPTFVENASVAIGPALEVALPRRPFLIGDVFYVRRLNLWSSGHLVDEGEFAPLELNATSLAILHPSVRFDLSAAMAGGSEVDVELAVTGSEGLVDLEFPEEPCPLASPPRGGGRAAPKDCGLWLQLPAPPVRYRSDLSASYGRYPFAQASGGLVVAPLGALLPVARNANVTAVSVRFALPDGWSLVSPLPSRAPGLLAAEGVPIEEVRGSSAVLGSLSRSEGEAGGVPFALYRSGLPPGRVEERAARIRRYLPYLAGVFGEWPPTNVTVALLPPREGADRACFGATEGGLVLADSRPGCDEEAHELVHLWLMGPVRPASPGELWFIEGASEYYGLKARLAAGELDEEGFLAAVRHPAEDAALAGFRLDDAGARSAYDPVAREALYARGAAAVHELDLAIAAGDASGLDPLMARLYRGFGRSQRPLTNDDIASEASALAGSDLGPLVRALVNGTGAVSPSVAPPSGPACEAEEACLGELERLRRRERALWAVAALMAVLAVLRRRASAPA